MVQERMMRQYHPLSVVILMVAITVILAAVIAAFVFGMSGISEVKDCGFNCDTEWMLIPLL